MALFKKEGKHGLEPPSLPELPKLPDLPELPAKGSMDSGARSYSQEIPEEVPQLPSFPASKSGDKFSQSMIKEAISGKASWDKEVDDMEDEDADDFAEEKQMMWEPPKPAYKQLSRYSAKVAKKEEPIFVQIDKFEEGLKNFEEIKLKISEIEKLLLHTKKIKEQEEHELSSWELEIQAVKVQVEKIERDLFSKLE